jgi:hypothetical protein
VVPDSNNLSAEGLRALVRKYERLSALRARRDGEGAPATRDELRDLASEFPGCLRELDTLGLAELGRRTSLCAAVAAGSAAPEPWMAWIDGYHALMRQALQTRGARSRGEPPDAADDFGLAVLTPPGGRMGVVILRTLSVRFGVSAGTIAAALFPVRRPSPYGF